jgi:hypothetical protein
MTIQRPTEPTPNPHRIFWEMDGLLQEYFQAEMPDPWPAPPKVRKVAAPSRPRRNWWSRARRPLALAAVLLLFAGGYQALTIFCPDVLPKLEQRGKIIGDAPKVKDTPNRGKIIDRVQILPDNQFEINVKRVQTPPSGAQP